ncbi:MAG TPA: cytochrome c [Chloroflexia bacterium]|nr:cytochrome c [Chloroflexia bacterium]
MKTTKLKWLWPALLLSTLLAACGDVDRNSTDVSANVRPGAVIAAAQQNNNFSSGIPTDPTRGLTQAAGATATALPPTPTPAQPAPTAAPSGGGSTSNTPSGAATTAPSGGGTTGDAANGLKLFQANGCVGCHPNGGRVAGVGPKLAGTTRDDTYIHGNIRNGRGAMPAFPADQISDAQINDLIAYIRSLK